MNNIKKSDTLRILRKYGPLEKNRKKNWRRTKFSFLEMITTLHHYFLW